MKKIYIVVFTVLAFCGYTQTSGNCNNIGFENGTTSGWYLSSGNVTGVHLPCNNCTIPGSGIATVVTNSTTIGTQCQNGIDTYLGSSVVAPNGGSYSLLLNNNSAGGKIQQVIQTLAISPSNSIFTFQFAAVLQKNTLPDSVAPYFSFEIFDANGYSIACSKYNTSDTNSSISHWQTSVIDPTVQYIPWNTVSLDLLSYLGQNLTVVFTVSDGSNGSSFGYAYIDAACNNFNSNYLTQSWAQTICNGSTAQLAAPAGFSYSWLGPVMAFTTQTFTTNMPGTYSLTLTSLTGCQGNYYVFDVSNTCDSVWPGDANNDLVADANDILAIGVGNLNFGWGRNNSSINWVAQPSAEWTDTLSNGVNYKHIDCNGDGVIELDDTLAVIQNFNLTHAARYAGNTNHVSTTGIPITLVPHQNTILAGNTGTFDIMLGNSANTVNNAYGIAFTMQFDNTYIDENSISVSGNNSWMGTANTNLMAVALKASSETEFAITKIDQTNVSGQGKIGEISFKTLSNSNNTTSFSIIHANLISYDQTNIPIDISASIATVNIVNVTTDIDQAINGNYCNIYPNPNNGKFTIETNSSSKQTVQIFDVNGRLVLTQNISGMISTINANVLSNGIYNINIISNEGIVNKRLIITKQ